MVGAQHAGHEQAGRQVVVARGVGCFRRGRRGNWNSWGSAAPSISTRGSRGASPPRARRPRFSSPGVMRACVQTAGAGRHGTRQSGTTTTGCTRQPHRGGREKSGARALPVAARCRKEATSETL